MSTHDDNPLRDAVRAAEAEAGSYEVPVDRVRVRVRRRRARRWAVAGVGTLAAAALVVAVVPRLAPDDTAADGPPVDGLCGQEVRALGVDDTRNPRLEARPRIESAALSPTAAALVVATDGEQGALVDLPGPPVGWVYGATIAVVRDGVVVALQDGPGAPDTSDAAAMAADFGAQPFPLVTTPTADLRTCAGRPLPAGEYQVVTTQTIGWTTSGGGHEVVRATSLPVAAVFGADGVPSGPQPLTCGASEQGLRALADPRTNPSPYVLSRGAEPAPDADGMVAGVRVTNDGPEAARATTSHPLTYLVRDGVIVAGPHSSESGPVDASLAAGASKEFAARFTLTGCAEGDDPAGGGDRLPPGEYQRYVVMTFTPTPVQAQSDTGVSVPQDDADDWQAAGGPWPTTIP